jgi:hypothetical protein
MKPQTQGAVDRREPPLSLAELVDLELQLHDDADAEPSALLARDSAVSRAIGANELAGSSHALMRAWLGAVRGARGHSVGRRVQAYFRLAGWAASAFMLISGATTAAALLRYDGRDPVNIMGFLAVLVGLQLVVLCFGVAGMLPAPWRRRVVALTGIQEMLRDLGYHRSGLPAALAAARSRSAKADAVLGRVTATQSIYAGVEKWLLTSLTQRAGVAFNVGALAVCVYSISVKALAFAWSTTLTVDPETMTRMFGVIAAPWGFIAAAVPDRDLVEASRYFPGRDYDPDRLGDWWPFLIAALSTYGLLPRVLLASYASYRERAARRTLALDHGEAGLVRERLLRSAQGFGPGVEEGIVVPEQWRIKDGTEPASVRPLEPGDVRVIVWADAALTEGDAKRLVEAKFARRIAAFVAARGEGDAAERAAIASLAASGTPDAPILLVAEAWEPPSKSLLHFLRRVRGLAEASTPIVVGLIGAAARTDLRDEVRVWRRRLTALGDPRLRVEALQG